MFVDDVDQLSPDQLRYLVDNAERTNTKLLLVTSTDDGRAHTLTAVLTKNLPWAQQLGTTDQRQAQHATTAIDRAEHHLATTSASGPHHDEAAQLLRRRDQLLVRYRDLITDQSRGRDTTTDRSRGGLEL